MSRRGQDRPAAVRAGEELDRERLEAYLGSVVGEVRSLEVEQFPSGFSNLTYLLRIELEGGVRELVLRRPPFGSKVRSAHDMGREFRILSGLEEVYERVPGPIHHCDDEAVLGAPFYLMERVRGRILRGRLAPDQAPAPDVMRGIAESFIAALAELHEVDVAAAGLADLGRPEGYVRRQVEGWVSRYEKARTDDVPDLERAAAWLVEKIGAESGAALVHNDFKYDNVVLDLEDPTRVVAVLDWEMATIGDPLLDLGTTLAYWVDPDDPEPLQALGLTPTTLPGNPSRRVVAERYQERRPFNEEHLVFAYVFGLTKIAVIVQQIYYRYRAGHTEDPRFAHLDRAVRALGWAASRAVDLGRIDSLAG